MSRFIYGTAEAASLTDYGQSTIRNKTKRVVKIISYFAIKLESGDWLLDDKAIAYFIITKSRVKIEGYASTEEYALDKIYGYRNDEKLPLALKLK